MDIGEFDRSIADRQIVTIAGDAKDGYYFNVPFSVMTAMLESHLALLLEKYGGESAEEMPDGEARMTELLSKMYGEAKAFKARKAK